MFPTSGFRSREEVLDSLDNYATQRKDEIDRRDVKLGLIKSYVIETSSAGGEVLKTASLLERPGWYVFPIGEGDIFGVHDNDGPWGFAEAISPRYMMLHTYRNAADADKTVQKWVNYSAALDTLWLSGDYFSVLWKDIILPLMPDRFISFKFEHLARFEDNMDGIEVPTDEPSDEWTADEIVERRASTSSITEQAKHISEFLPRLQEEHNAFKAISRLRMPADTRGGFEFWSWGKVTHRAPSFREGREQIISITQLYSEATSAIERILWFRTGQVAIGDNSYTTLRGAPLTLEFSQPLSLESFRNFVSVTFEHGQGPLRLWGNPIWLGEKKVHVYAIDLHLWKRIYIEITPRRMTAILPEGTCGNTVHRLITNVQRYVDAGAKSFIGDTAYSDLVRNALLGRLNA